MNRIVFATHNKNKLIEAQAKIQGNFIIISLDELNFHDEIDETETTIEGNAKLKADYIFNHFNLNCFSDDTGLEVEALNGAPGVYSSRYAGPHVSYEDNVKKLLQELKGITNRKARFRTSICLILNGKHYYFDGTVNGIITEKPSGTSGFGYDPIFLPEGFDNTFAELPLETKNKISHRGKALDKLCEFLNKITH